MNKEAMQQQILEALYKRLGDGFHISIQKVLKTNVKLDGLTILQDGKNISPTIYLDSFYKDLENGISLDDVVSGILRIYSEAEIHPSHFDITAIRDFSHIRDRLYVELINRHSNKELLQDVPHSLFLDDFAVTVRCSVEMTSEGSASFLVHNSHLKMWQVEQEYFISHAIQNTRKLLGVELAPLESFIKKICPEMAGCDGSIPKTPLWIMTNKRNLSGAATVLFDDVLSDFAREHGNFYVIFSSVHEVLLVLTPDNSDIDSITKMNQEVNATQVAENEILGTKAYYYCKDKGFVL